MLTNLGSRSSKSALFDRSEVAGGNGPLYELAVSPSSKWKFPRVISGAFPLVAPPALLACGDASAFALGLLNAGDLYGTADLGTLTFRLSYSCSSAGTSPSSYCGSGDCNYWSGYMEPIIKYDNIISTTLAREYKLILDEH